MTPTLIILMTLAYLASMAAMTGFALRLSRRNLQLTIERDSAIALRDDWKTHSRVHARRANREESLRVMFEARSARAEEELMAAKVEVGGLVDQRDEIILELAEVRKDLIQAIHDRDLAKDIGEEPLRERDHLMFENEILRADDEDPGLELAN